MTLLGAIAAASWCGTRGSLPVLVVAVAAWLGVLTLPAELGFLATIPAIAVLGALAAIEELTEWDDDLQELIDTLHYGLRGIHGALVVWALIGAEHSGVATAAACLPAIAGAVGMHAARSQVHALLRGFGTSVLSPRSWLTGAELAAVGVTLLGVLFFPWVALLTVAGFAVAAAGLAGVTWAVDRWWMRRPCPSCAARIRPEARRCPKCADTVPIVRFRGLTPRAAPAAPHP